MDGLVHLHAIVFHQIASGIEIAFALDALHLGKEFAKEGAQFLVVVDFYIGFAISLHIFNHIIGFSLLVAPFANDFAIAHVCFLDVFSRLDASELSEQAIHNVFVIFRLIGVGVLKDAQFQELRVCHVVECKEVGTGFFKGRAIIFEQVNIHTRKHFARTMTQTFV